jgi:hypothetical protein
LPSRNRAKYARSKLFLSDRPYKNKRPALSNETMLRRPCNLSGALGAAGAGFHVARVPGTRTAAADYAGTIALAWAPSAASGLRLSVTTVAVPLAAELMHWLLCVPVGSPAPPPAAG